MTRTVLNFNTEWKFIGKDIPKASDPEFDDSAFESICLPHSNRTFPHHYFTEKKYQFISWYRRLFYLDNSAKERRIIIEFDGVMTVATVYINGKQVCEHRGGYTGFSCDITDLVKLGEQNTLAVKVDSRERRDVPPEGGNVDYMQFGGIYRNVRLVLIDPLHIQDIFVISREVMPDHAKIAAQVLIKNVDDNDRVFTLRAQIRDATGLTVAVANQEGTLASGSTDTINLESQLERPHLWHIDNPYLYTLQVDLFDHEVVIDQVSEPFGVRKAEFRNDGRFYLNGEPIKLRGLDRHQTFPYLGAAMPDRVQRKDADILKYELGLNFVRSSHYPPSPSFLARCDEIGLLVFEELPGWVFVGDENWKNTAKQNLREMILRDRNHPSVILWGVRINESFDHHDFYIETNRIAHELDPSRPTGGVRYFADSEFLEDVFTINDFEENLQGKLHTPVHTPSLVTEYMGHMYPTKSYDREERLIEHAKLHARIQSCAYGIPNLAGACGWCAFDYYTTSGFGAGDHICYHGVCDVFRLPKFAAHFYKSQMDPKYGVELFIARYLTPEFNDIGDEVTVFSNCDRVDLYIDGEKFDSQTPDTARYPNLPHPPFTFTGIQATYKDKLPNKHEATYEWNEMAWAIGRWLGQRVHKIEAVGFINGKETARSSIEMFGNAAYVVLEPDDTELFADGTDCTRLVVKILDEKGQALPLAHNAVRFEVSGPGKLIGENPLTVERGMSAIYIGATRKAGIIVVKAESEFLQGDSIQIRVLEPQEKFVPTKA